MRVCSITATAGRSGLLSRAVRCFLEQDYGNKVLLIYQNSDVYQELHDSLKDKNIILINQHIDSATGQPYTNLGAIYNDAIKYVPEDVDIINFQDDDDVVLSNHISEGVSGYQQALSMGCLAYKPKFSYYRHGGGITPMCNVFEPSIFVAANHIKEHGFHVNTKNQHHKWLDGLGDKMFMSDRGVSTLVYDWNTPGCFKTSGNPDAPENFDNYRSYSQDHGNRIIYPCPVEVVKRIYDEIAECVNIN